MTGVTNGGGAAITSITNVANVNPIRYRGYYYDTDTSLYYCQSRYYDPEVGRWISADAAEYAMVAAIWLNDTNLFAYCGNNPINNMDADGEFFFTALGALTGAIGGAVTALIEGKSSEEILEAGINGAIGGMIAGAGIDAGLLIVGTGGAAGLAVGAAYLCGALGNAYTTYASSNGTASADRILGSAIIGGTFNVISFGTSLGCAADTLDGIIIRGMMDFNNNLVTGTMISTNSSIATEIGTTTRDTVVRDSPVFRPNLRDNLNDRLALMGLVRKFA